MGELANHPCIPKLPLAVTVTNWNQLNTLNTTVTEITAPSNSLNDASLTVLDLSRFRRLKKLVIGDGCFMNVDQLNLIGLSKLRSVVIGNNQCNAESVTELDLSKYPLLKSVTIGDESFMYVNEVSIIGLSDLESVQIGKNSFTKKKNGSGNDPNRHFYLKNCPKLKSLKMGRYSFSDYTVIEIENVDALEVIEMGDLNEWSYNFYYASLELKSILIHNE